MARVPNLPVRARLVDPRTSTITREWVEFFEATRLAIGGDAASTVPVVSPDGLEPVAVASAAPDPLAPVSAFPAAPDALEPV